MDKGGVGMAMFEVRDTPAASFKLYSREGGLYPSVTDILGIVSNKGFENWKKVPGNAKKLENASTFGTKIHSLASDLALGKKVQVAEELEPYCQAIEQFLSDHVWRVLGSEMELVSLNHKFGGTLDLYVIAKDQRRMVVDFKTTSSLTRMHGLQLSGYRQLLQDNGLPVSRRMGCRLKKERPGAYAVRTFEDEMGDSQAFFNALNLWHWKYGPTLKKKLGKQIADRDSRIEARIALAEEQGERS